MSRGADVLAGPHRSDRLLKAAPDRLSPAKSALSRLGRTSAHLFESSGSRECQLWTTLPQRPIGADRRSGLQQQRQVLPGQGFDAGFCRVNGDVERGNHLVGTIAHWCGNGANAGRQMFVGKCPSPLAYLAEYPVALFLIWFPERRDAGAAWLGKHPF